MIYTVIGKVGEKVGAELPSSINEYIDNTKNISLKEARRTAYSILLIAMDRLFPDIKVKLSRTDKGKPYIERDVNPIYIRLTHSNGLCAVAVCDDREVGIDIEASVDKDRAKRLERRFLDGVSIPKRSLQAEILYFSDGELSKECPNGIKLPCTCSEGFTDKWVCSEAAMKCEGGGFSSFTNLERLFSTYDFLLLNIETGGEIYSLSIASEKTKKMR